MCVKTLSALKVGVQANGKAVIKVLSKKRSLDDSHFIHVTNGSKIEFLQLPCGQCIECRLKRSREWAMRCMHEASLYDSNCFITLTFNDDYVDPVLSLRKHHFQKFMKRLRKYLSSDGSASSRRVRYFHAGEYGEKFGRPHHHAILFNYDFPDKILCRQDKGFNYYRSELLSKLWSDPVTGESYGIHEISDVTFESCAYVARYVCKKVNGAKAEDHYQIMDDLGNFHQREPEYCTMSRRPGIGLDWYEKYKDTDVWAHDSITLRSGAKCTPPRYYGSKYELTNPGEYALIKEKRLLKCKDNPDNRFDRQAVRETVKKAQFGFLKRSLA